MRPWTQADVPFLSEAFADPAIAFWHAHAATEPTMWVTRMEQRWRAEEGGDWAIEAAGEPVGRIGLHHVDMQSASVEVGYWLHPAHRGKGLASGALETITQWAYNQGVHRIQLNHSTRNPASCAVAIKCAYAFEGTAISAVLHEDGWHDMHVHARINPAQDLERL